MRCTPSRIVLGLGMSSRPQQESDLWTGQYSLRRSLIAFPPGRIGEISRWYVAIGTVAIGKRVSPMGCYNACPRGTMTNLTGVIRTLRKERQRVHGEMERLNAALAALGSLAGLEGKAKRSRAPKVRRPMSAAARKKIAAAQRARWAKWKKNKRTK
jgi:hypothetical protein